MNDLAGSQEKDSMLDFFIFETTELLSQLENIILNGEKESITGVQIDEIFRIVHTIKGSASMMNFEDIASLSHLLEDAFYYLREKRPKIVDYSALTDIVLRSTDFIKNDLNKIQAGSNPDSDVSAVVHEIKEFISSLKSKKELPNKETKSTALNGQKNKEIHDKIDKNRFKALIFFEDGCDMENIRAFNVVHNLEKLQM